MPRAGDHVVVIGGPESSGLDTARAAHELGLAVGLVAAAGFAGHPVVA